MDLLYTAHVPPGEGPFPTVLALHGWGASAHDLLGLAPVLHGGQALVLCPQGEVAFEVAPGMAGFGWWPISPNRGIDPEAFGRAAASLRRFLDQACQRYPIDPRKIVAMGFSQGGVMATDLVLREPARFAGLIALSTWLPDVGAPPCSEPEALKNLPVLLMHGSRDPMIPLELARQARQKLLSLGMNVHYREHEMQHEISPEALQELVAWLEEKVFNLIQLA